MNFWKLQQSAQAGTVELYIYSDIEEDGIDWKTGEMMESETSAEHFRKELERVSPMDRINIYINSLGGSVLEGTAIYNQLKRCKAYKTVYIDGYACSIASVIAMAGDRIIMPRNTCMMIHNAWVYACGNAEQLRRAADQLDKINEAGRQAYLERSKGKIDEETLITLMNEESYLTAKDCITYGFADEYAEENADLEKACEMLKKAGEKAGEQMKQYATRLDKVCALAKCQQQNQPTRDSDAAMQALKTYFGL